MAAPGETAAERTPPTAPTSTPTGSPTTGTTGAAGGGASALVDRLVSDLRGRSLVAQPRSYEPEPAGLEALQRAPTETNHWNHTDALEAR